MGDDIKKLKKLIVKFLQEENNNHMEYKQQLKNFIISILLTFTPVLVFLIAPTVWERYYDVFSGRFMYLAQDYYFSFSPIFILDLPYFLPPILWVFAIWFLVKLRKNLINTGLILRYALLVLIVLDIIFFLYSLWFLFSVL